MNDLSELQLFSLLKKIPYENVSKILRLLKEPEDRPRNSQTLLSEHLEKQHGGTCFSLVNLIVKSLKVEGVRAFPVKADIHRRTFPHFFAIIENDNKNYLVDPGYLINDPIELKETSISTKPGSPIDFEISKDTNGKYTLNTVTTGIKKERYSFSISEVSENDFQEYWVKSFDYINDIVASRNIDNKFIYINGNYVQIRSKGNVEKYNSAEKSNEYLNKYFNFDIELIERAKEILAYHK
jgi:arylamine N-acetyltransferase